MEQLVLRAEYKRRQAPPGVKIGVRNFGRDRRYPISNFFHTGPEVESSSDESPSCLWPSCRSPPVPSRREQQKPAANEAAAVETNEAAQAPVPSLDGEWVVEQANGQAPDQIWPMTAEATEGPFHHRLRVPEDELDLQAGP